MEENKNTIACIIPAHIIIRALSYRMGENKMCITYSGRRTTGAWQCDSAEQADGIALYFQKLKEAEDRTTPGAMLYSIGFENGIYYVEVRDKAMLLCDKTYFEDYDSEHATIIEDDRIFDILRIMEKNHFSKSKFSGITVNKKKKEGNQNV